MVLTTTSVSESAISSIVDGWVSGFTGLDYTGAAPLL